MAVTNLTGYTWVGKTDISGLSYRLYSINFTSNNRYFNKIEYDSFVDDTDSVRIYEINNPAIFVYNDNGHLIELTLNEWLFTGGTDVTNTTLISWLENNGTLTLPEPEIKKNMYVGSNKVSKVMVGDKAAKKILIGDNVIYEVEPPEPPTNVVRFVSASARTITPKYTNSGITLQYSVDNGSTWTTISSGSATTSATEHWFRGQATGTKSLFTSNTSSNAWSFSGSSDLEVYGNLNFLLCNTLGDEVAPTSLGTYAYASMFHGRTALTTAPELPATTLAGHCYQNMFYGCTSLTTAPELPATRLASDCYPRMFMNCTSLTTAPELPATTLADYCYVSMFYDCTSLTTAPKLPATSLRTYCYSDMFIGCTSFKVSATSTGSYIYAWRIPTSGTGTTATWWNSGMLSGTGGTFTSNPTINTTYYVENQPV